MSHGHQAQIAQCPLVTDPGALRVVVRENRPDTARQVPGQVELLENARIAGFGANHNATFRAVAQGLEPDDWFVICNPDVTATAEEMEALLRLAEADAAMIAAPYLWNSAAQAFDHNVRPFPTILSLVRSFLGAAGAGRYDEAGLAQIRHPDWASGALLAVRAGLYRDLGGYDERYFMYMEDADFCRRAAGLGAKVRFYPEIRMTHDAARSNRRFLSARFRNHVASALRYFWRWRGRGD